MEALRGTPGDRCICSGGNKRGQSLGLQSGVDALHQLDARDDVVARPDSSAASGVTDGHELDKANVQRSVDGELGKLREILVERFHGNAIHLYRVEAHGKGCVDAGKRVF